MWMKCGQNRINIESIKEYYVKESTITLVDKDNSKRTLHFDSPAEAIDAIQQIDAYATPMIDLYEFFVGKTTNEIFSKPS